MVARRIVTQADPARAEPVREKEFMDSRLALDKPLLTVSDVAQLFQVHERTVRRWVGEGKLTCVQVEGCVRFDPDDVARWVSARSET
jgi:excisionase family DNA binding protein